MVDFILVVIELFRYLLWLKCYKRKSVEVGIFQREMGHFERRFQREGGTAHQPLFVSENYSDCHFVWYENICSPSFSFVTIHASDRQTDRQNCNSNTMRCITCSRTVKIMYSITQSLSHSPSLFDAPGKICIVILMFWWILCSLEWQHL